MNLNLGLLMPEWIIAGTIVILLLKEIFSKNASGDSRGSGLIASLGILASFFGTIPFAGKIDSAFGGMFLLDPFSTFFKAFFALTAFVVVQMSGEYFKNRKEHIQELVLIVLCTLLGLFVLASANDFLLLFVALEIVTLSFYIMASYQKRDLTSIEAGLKYLILGSLASALTIYGISLLYTVVGSTSFANVRDAFNAASNHKMMIMGLLMIVSGIGFKVASVPFQLWVPDVYEGAPTPVVSFLSVASKAAGFALLLRILFSVFSAFDIERVYLFSVLAAMTMLYGNLGALLQTNIKRLFGYSSIGHAGYLLIGIATGGLSGTTAVLYYLIAYGVTTLTVFLVITIASGVLRSDELSSYRGLSKRSPFLAAVMFLALLSSAGVPPLAGFSGKFFILLAAVKANILWLALLGALGVAISLYYYLTVVKTMYFDNTEQDQDITVSSPLRVLLVILSLSIVVVGIWQAPFMGFAEQASKYLF